MTTGSKDNPIAAYGALIANAICRREVRSRLNEMSQVVQRLKRKIRRLDQRIRPIVVEPTLDCDDCE